MYTESFRRRTRDHKTTRHHVECLEARRLLAIDRPFVDHIWETTLGDANHVAFIADLDSDGVDDLIAYDKPGRYATPGNPRVRNASWYKLDAESNRFQFQGVISSRRDNSNYLPVAGADFDLDGDTDLLVKVTGYGGIDNYVSYMWQENLDGAGTFGEYQRVTDSSASELWTTVYIADLDEDGDLDVAYEGDSWMTDQRGWCENIGGKFFYHQTGDILNNADAHLYDVDGDGQRRVPNVIDGPFATSDLDGDGDLDQVIANSSRLWWQENLGQATFENHVLYDDPGSIVNYLVTDIDHDQDDDIWLKLTDELLWLENNSAGQFELRSPGFKMQGSIELADFLGGANDQIAALDGALGDVSWYDFDAETNSATGYTAEVPLGEDPQHVLDMNGDGSLDVVGLRAWYDTSGSLESPIEHSYDLDRRIEASAPIDVDQDGKMDLAVAWNTGTFYDPKFHLSWFQVGDGGLTGERPIAFDVQNNLNELRALDLDLDGDADLLTLGDHRLEWYERTSGPEEFVFRGAYIDGYVRSIDDMADLDHDGDYDVLREDDALLSWFERLPDGQFAKHAITRSGDELGSFAYGDIDADNDFDVIVATDGVIIVYKNISDGNRWVLSEVSRDADVRQLYLADLNGDDDLDIVVGSYQARTWIEDLPPFPDATYTFFDNQDGRGEFAPAENQIHRRGLLAVIADLDGDGDADLIEAPSQMAGIIVHENVTPNEFAPGDVNRDGQLDAADVDQLCAAIGDGDTSPELDLNGDGDVNYDDFGYFVETIAGWSYGDANLDGRFDSADFVWVMQRGHYERDLPFRSGWQDGDWNCDGAFTTSDLVIAMQRGDYSDGSTNDLILVAHRESNQVLSFDATSGDFVAVFATLESPIDIAVGPDGDVYVAQQTMPTKLSRFRAGGQLVTSIEVAAAPEVPHIAFGPDGYLYINYFAARRIERFDVSSDSIVSLGDAISPSALSGASVDGFDVGPNGDLYVSVRQTETIWRFSGQTGERLEDFAAVSEPDGFTFGPDGDLYVGSQLGQVLHFDGMTSQFVDVLIDQIPYVYGGINPVFTTDGHLLISLVERGGDAKINRYDAMTGEWIDVFIGDGPVGLEFPAEFVVI